ncbi:hypothetical protein D9M68_833940 [compost metagenome]
MLSVTLAFSLFCATVAAICSTDALVSSTLAACSEAFWLSAWAEAATCSEAEARESAVTRTSPMIERSRMTICCRLKSMLLWSPSRS